MDNTSQSKGNDLPIPAESKNEVEHRSAAAEVNPQPVSDAQDERLREALRALLTERDTPSASYQSGPATGLEGQPMQSMPGHKMLYNEQPGIAGVEIEAPDGRLTSFGGKSGLERFIEDNKISAEDSASLRAIDARADPFRTQEQSSPKEDRTQDAIDNAMLREIERRGELRLDQTVSPEADQSMAKADVSAFNRIENPAMQGHAAAQIADNARDSEVYKASIKEGGIADQIQELDAQNTAKMWEKEERKSADMVAIRAEREERARGWGPEEAQREALREAQEYRVERNANERLYMQADMALNAAANPHYKAALEREAPEIARAEVTSMPSLNQQASAAMSTQKDGELAINSGTEQQLALRRARDSRLAAEEMGLNGIEPAVEPLRQQQMDATAEKERDAWLKKAESEPDNKAETTREAGRNQVGSDEIFTANQPEIKPVVPPDVERQYTRVGDKFYHPKNPNTVVFEDKGNKLETKSSSEAVASNMVRIAEARGWDEIKVSGSETFRKEAWLEAASRGMHVKGYTPSEQDKAELAKRDVAANKVEKDLQPAHARESEEINSAQSDAAKADSSKHQADSFAKDSAQDAVRKHPELAGAVAVMSAIDKKVDADGLNEQQRQAVMARVKQNVVNSIERGELPEVKVREAVEVKRERKDEREYSR